MKGEGGGVWYLEEDGSKGGLREPHYHAAAEHLHTAPLHCRHRWPLRGEGIPLR